MAAITTDYQAALDYLQQAKIRDCRVSDSDAPDQLDSIDIGYLAHGFEGGNGEPVRVQQDVQVFTTGWNSLEGVMVVAPEPDFNADLRVCLAANSERALQDLLLSFPPGQVGFCYFSADWMLPGIEQALQGRVLPAREGYFATDQTLIPQQEYPARAIGENDYALVQGQWSENVWKELLDERYCFHACDPGGELCALCFHWEVAPWREEVHGLQAVKDFARPFAESAISSATAHVLAAGKIATCTANREDDRDGVGAFRRVGYRKFYRIPSYLGARRGGAPAISIPNDAFQRGSMQPSAAPAAAPAAAPGAAGEGRTIARGKDPVIARFCDLAHERGRREYARFLVEGLMLVERAIADGLGVESLIYTPSLLRCREGIALLSRARQRGIDHYQVSEGLMAKVTTTRPPAAVIAAVHFRMREAASLAPAPGSTLLVAENISNPDNLGMIIRTADAAGVDAMIVAGADPLHKNCVRAARGAVGRIPLFVSESPVERLPHYLRSLRGRGIEVVGAALDANRELYRSAMAPPIALVVGNEQSGLTRSVLEACSSHISIPMAPGQNSLNVGVAAGVILYEIARQNSLVHSHPTLIPR